MTCDEYAEWVAAHVDGCLTAREQRAVDSHVPACSRCGAVYREQLEVRRLIHEYARRTIAVPAAIREQVRTQINVADGGARRTVVWLRLLVVGTVAAALWFALSPLLREPPSVLLPALAADVHEVLANGSSLAIHSEDIEQVRQYYRSTGLINFERSADDFSAAGLRLVGASVRLLENVPTTFTVYDGPLGKVVCRRFRVGALRLPQGGERIGHDEVFTIGDVTIAVMHLGDIICTLATNVPHDEFVRQLKASKGL